MATPKSNGVLFTPEYSDQLLQRIQQIYKEDILHAYPQLKLQKLIDLLEHTQYLLELYLKFISQEGSQNDALRSFIIGCFYIYLIMPQSIQFQSKNKSHTIYNEVRSLYEAQLNMTNVSLMVKDEVEIILECNIQSHINKENARITRKRAYSVPSNGIDKSPNLTPTNDLIINVPNITVTKDLSHDMNQLHLDKSPNHNQKDGKTHMLVSPMNNLNNIPIYRYQPKTGEDSTSSTNTGKGSTFSIPQQINNPTSFNGSDSEDSEDQKPPLWKAPNLEPNDQLKLATFMTSSDVDEETNEYEMNLDREMNKNTAPAPTYSPPPLPSSSPKNPQDHLKDNFQFNNNNDNHNQNNSIIPKKKRNQSLTSFVHSYTTTFDNVHPDPVVEERTSADSDRSFMADRSLTHRKNSYHSVYMLDTDETTTNSNFYDESNGFIQTLDRLQKQSIINAPELFCLLSNKQDNDNLLLIDLRTDSRYEYSHVIATNLVHIDPRLLWDSQTNLPIYEMDKLEAILEKKHPHTASLFNKRDKFDYVVYYSDMKTFMRMKFDYHFTFFYLLMTSKERKLKRVPTTLLGGYEKWKKVMTNYSKEYDVQISHYLFRSNGPSSKVPILSHKKQPFPPSPNNQWKPLEVPVRLRKRPPPPPPSLIPESPDVVPKIPPRLRLENTPISREYPFMASSETGSYPSPVPSPSPNASFEIGGHDYPTPRRTSSPMVRKPERIPLVTVRSNKRHISQPNNNMSNSVIQRTYTIPTIERNPNIYVSLSITGLRNLGNTCYINSMIQCLFATREFRDLFISSAYKKYLKASKDKTPQLSNGFYLLFKKMYLNGGCSVVPISFLKICNILRPDLKIPDDQQDTTEFLMLILDRLHDELANQDEVVNDYPSLMLYNEKQLNVKEKDYKKWFDKNVIGNGLSPIDDIFQGQIEHSLQCQRCGFSSYNYSTFYILSLAIPKPTISSFSKGKRVKLEDCLNMYTSDEVLSGENAWECPHCCKISNEYKDIVEKNKVTKQLIKDQAASSSPSTSKSSSRKSGLFGFSRHHDHHHSNIGRDALKTSQKVGRSLSPFRVLGGGSSNESSNKKKIEQESLKLEKIAQKENIREIKDEMKQWKTKKLITVKTLNFLTLPKTLIIHLSRFYYDLTKKNDTIITYPLMLEIPTKNGQLVKYKLFGLVNHTGNLISGHYTSLVNKAMNHSLDSDSQKWYYFDDEVVKEETKHGDYNRGITKISSSDVYVLFYERIN